MKTHRLVLPTHLNHYGLMYGGELLKWIDEAGYIAANLAYSGNEFVTVGLNNVAFNKSIPSGSILEFDASIIATGKSSVRIGIEVFCIKKLSIDTVPPLVFKTEITFVSIDKDGKSIPIVTQIPKTGTSKCQIEGCIC